MPGSSPLRLLSSDARSLAFFRRLRWHGKPACPRCSHRRFYRLASHQYRCAHCRYKFSDFTGTWLGKLRLPLSETAHLLYLFTLGVPAYRARRYSSASLKTMHRAFLLFREAIYEQGMQELSQLTGEIELDEAAFGGHRKGRRGWAAAGKTLVFGLYKRNGHVLTFPVPDRKKATLLPLIEAHTKPGSLYYTDEYWAYASLRVRGEHVVVSKKDGRPHGRDHINGIEGFWSYAKTWLYQYRGVPRQNFPLYLKEVEFRFNHRDEDLFQLLANLIVQPVPDPS
jgi:transposase